MSVSHPLFEQLDAAVASLEPAVVALRRHLHRFPELSWQERGTQAFLNQWLTERGCDVHPVAGTGLWTQIGSGSEAPVAYRADIDALPIADIKQPGRVPCVSQVSGVSHACGHDVHSAVAAGLAAVFQGLRAALPQPVRVVFQPAEEVHPSGARRLIDEGGLGRARAALALHCDPTRDCGTVGLRTGPLTSTADSFVVDVLGEAGHSARPHLSRDAILGASAVIQALYHLRAQRVDPLEPAVLNLGQIEGGRAVNVLAGKVTMTGVLRTLYGDTRERLHQELRRTVEAAAAVYGCTADIRFQLGSPPILNDERFDALLSEVAGEVLGPNGVQRIERPSMGAEDFGEFSVECPTYMLRLGVRAPGRPTHHLHTPGFDADERAIGLAMRVMGRAMLRV